MGNSTDIIHVDTWSWTWNALWTSGQMIRCTLVMFITVCIYDSQCNLRYIYVKITPNPVPSRHNTFRVRTALQCIDVDRG